MWKSRGIFHRSTTRSHPSSSVVTVPFVTGRLHGIHPEECFHPFRRGRGVWSWVAAVGGCDMGTVDAVVVTIFSRVVSSEEIGSQGFRSSGRWDRRRSNGISFSSILVDLVVVDPTTTYRRIIAVVSSRFFVSIRTLLLSISSRTTHDGTAFLTLPNFRRTRRSLMSCL